MDNNTILFLLFLACDLFLLTVFVVVRLVLRPVKPIELSKDDREYICRINRDKK
jgi:hypothetical protein